MMALMSLATLTAAEYPSRRAAMLLTMSQACEVGVQRLQMQEVEGLDEKAGVLRHVSPRVCKQCLVLKAACSSM